MSALQLYAPPSGTIQGTIRLNGSKSISNRVLIIDALCGNAIRMDNLSNADDTVFLQRLLKSQDTVLDAGAGGTTYRFMTAYLATQEGREVVLTGTERMQQRPIKILVDALRKLGADIQYEKSEGFPPLRIRGKSLNGGKISLPADTSSQYITALLLIAPHLEQGLELELQGTIVSRPYIRMTLKMMEYFGIRTSFEGQYIRVEPGHYQPRPFFVEGDWSAASYYYSLAILADKAELELEGLTDQEIQGDCIISKIAQDFGIDTQYGDHSVRLIKTERQVPATYAFDFLECPDLAQTIVAFCGALKTKLKAKGLQTLRIKETDRISALDTELRRTGLAAFHSEDEDTFELDFSARSEQPVSAVIETYEDHRMAMAFAPLALKISHLAIDEPSVVNKSYPEFWNDLKLLGFSYAESE